MGNLKLSVPQDNILNKLLNDSYKKYFSLSKAMPNKPVFVKIVFLLLFFAIGCENKEETTVNQTVKATSRLDFRKVVTEAKDKVFPTVVYIKCIRQNLEAGKKESQQVAGSGVIISPGGEVLTNWHVIDKAIEIRCLLLDGRAMDAKLLGKDKDTDLALLQLEKKADEDCLQMREDNPRQYG